MINQKDFLAYRGTCEYHSKPNLFPDDHEHAIMNMHLRLRHTCDHPEKHVYGNDNCQVYNCPEVYPKWEWPPWIDNRIK